ncbi:MAG: type II toxin-antitoxin system death-on-curing family toxin [Caldilineaceae bacterium]
MTFLFLRKQEILLLHTRLIELFGGSPGLRDSGALESALTAPENRASYENPSLAVRAATYAYHLTQAHAFVDGNKRVAAAATELFVELNGKKLLATNDQLVTLFLQIAAGEVNREEVEHFFTLWLD